MFWYLVLFLCILFIYYQIKSNQTRNENKTIELVTSGYYPIVGNLFSLINGRTGFVKKCRQIYGDTFRVKVFNRSFVFMLNPSDWSKIVKNDSFSFLGAIVSDTIFDMDHNFFGNAELDTELHDYYKKYLQRSDELEKLSTKFTKEMYSYIEREKRKTEKTDEWIQRGFFEFCSNILIFSIIKTFYGDVDVQNIQHNYDIFDSKAEFLFLLFPKWIYRLLFRNILQSRSNLSRYWLKKIHEYNESDLIRDRTNLMITNEEWFSKNDFATEKTLLLWSALSNLTPTLFWCLFYILRDEKVLQLVKKEIDENFPEICTNTSKGFSLGDNIPFEKFQNCVYMESIIWEVLRIYMNPMIMRIASKDTELVLKDTQRRITLKKDDITVFYPNIAHMDSKYFPNPNSFIFDRFVNKTSENSHGFIPFGTGKSICPGRLFARCALKLSIMMFLRCIEYKANDFAVEIPKEMKIREGLGVSHPDKDINFLFKYK